MMAQVTRKMIASIHAVTFLPKLEGTK